MIRRRLTTSQYGLLETLGSQLLSSLSNALVTVVGSILLTASDFGAMAVALIAFRLALMVSDGYVASVVMTRRPVLAGGDAERLDRSAVATTVVIGSVAGVLVLVAAGVLAATGNASAPSLAVMAVVLPVLLAHETLRVMAFTRLVPRDALAGDLTWVIVGGAMCMLVVTGIVDATGASLLAAWSLGAVAGVVVMVFRLPSRVRRPGSFRWYRESHGRLGGAFLADNSLAVGTAELAGAAIGAGLGLAPLGTWRVSTLLFSPVDPLRTGLMRWAIPRAAVLRDRPTELRRRMVVLSIQMALLSLSVGVPLAVLGLVVAFNSDESSAWHDLPSILVPAFLLTVTRAAVMSFSYLLRVEERSRTLIRIRVFDGLTLLLAVGIAASRSLEGVAWTYAVQRVVVAVVWIAVSVRRPVAQASPTGSSSAAWQPPSPADSPVSLPLPGAASSSLRSAAQPAGASPSAPDAVSRDELSHVDAVPSSGSHGAPLDDDTLPPPQIVRPASSFPPPDPAATARPTRPLPVPRTQMRPPRR